MTPRDDDREDTGPFRELVASSVDELDNRLGLDDRERQIAREVADLVTRGVGAIIRDRPANQRLAKLEIELGEFTAWRLRLTGVDDRNGRLGRIDRLIATLHEERRAADAALRADLGTPEQRARERKAADTVIGVRRWLWASATAAALSLGAGGWSLFRADRTARDAAAASAARIDTRLDATDKSIDHLYVLCGPRAAEPLLPRTP